MTSRQGACMIANLYMSGVDFDYAAVIVYTIARAEKTLSIMDRRNNKSRKTMKRKKA